MRDICSGSLKHINLSQVVSYSFVPHLFHIHLTDVIGFYKYKDRYRIG